MKKTLTTLVALFIITALFAFDVQIDNIYYNLNKTEFTATVTHDGKYTDDNNSGYTQTEIIIPSTISYNGAEYTVTSIGSSAFYKNTTIESISIPNTVTTIGSTAFYYCNALVSVSMPDSLETMGTNAFYYCSSLKSVTIPEGLTTIKSYTFYNCISLGEITIPSTVTTIENSAFYYCSSLTSITIPENVTKIGNSVFAYCSSIPTFSIHANLTSIGTTAFRYCASLQSIEVDENNPNYASIDGVLYNKDITTLIRCPEKKQSITIPSTVTTIDKSAFEQCKELTTISIPENVTTINDYAFAVCSSIGSFTIPSSIQRIAPYAFYNCVGLKSVYLSDSVNYIGNSAFAYCYSLASITIPNNVRNIERSTFTNCSKLNSIKLGNAVDSIRGSAFKGCSSLRDFNIATRIPPVVDSTAFVDIAGIMQLSVPCGTITDYKNTKVWKNFNNYKENVYSLTVVPNDESMGYVLIMQKPSCEDPTVELQANAFQNTDYKFKEWSDGTKENPYIFELTSDTTITAIFEYAPTPVENVNNSQVKVYTTDNTIYIEGLTNDYQILSTSGQLIYTGKQTSISLPKGIYILNIDNQTIKITL